MSVFVYTADSVTEDADRSIAPSCYSRTVAQCESPGCAEPGSHNHHFRCSRPAGHQPDLHISIRQAVIAAVWVVKR